MRFSLGMMTALTIITLFGQTPICNILLLALIVIPAFVGMNGKEVKSSDRGRKGNHKNARGQNRIAS